MALLIIVLVCSGEAETMKSHGQGVYIEAMT